MIRSFDAVAMEARLSELADILVDAVAYGASVNFLAGFSHDQAETFWRGQIAGIASNRTQLLVAEDGKSLVAQLSQ